LDERRGLSCFVGHLKGGWQHWEEHYIWYSGIHCGLTADPECHIVADADLWLKSTVWRGLKILGSAHLCRALSKSSTSSVADSLPGHHCAVGLPVFLQYLEDKVSKVSLFCPVSKCSVKRVLSCLDLVSNLQLELVCKRSYTADRTGQNCSVSDILRTTENSLDLSPILFTPPTRHDKTVLFFFLWCELGLLLSAFCRVVYIGCGEVIISTVTTVVATTPCCRYEKRGRFYTTG